MHPFGSKTLFRFAGALALGLLLCGCGKGMQALRERLRESPRLVGYWHNWHADAVPFIQLKDIPESVDTVVVAFAIPDASGKLHFKPHAHAGSGFKAQVRGLQNRGCEVLISIGGAGHPVELDTPEMRDRFVASVKKLMDRYGFDGIDINFEGKSMNLDPDDTDFRNPTTPKVVHLIQALRELHTYYGGNFLITFAPEVKRLVGGYLRYGEDSGGYLPVLYALREELAWVHMQYYNAGSQYHYREHRGTLPPPVLDESTADFLVGLSEMLILGFPVGNDPNAYFPGLGEEKVVLGLPASRRASFSGAVLPSHFEEAVDYLRSGDAGYSTRIQLREEEGFPNLGGVMNWSLNWDALPGPEREPFAFVQFASEILNRPPEEQP